MDVINVGDAKAHLSRILARVEAGEELVISRAGRPIARLVPFSPARTQRTFGGWRGRVSISKDFDAPLPESIAATFRGEE